MSGVDATTQGDVPNKKLMVRCPSCGVMHAYGTENPYRPFCCKGCKAIDLGAWASESYRVETKPTGNDLLDDPAV